MAVQWGLAGEGYDALQSLQVAGQAQQQRLQAQKLQAQLAAQQRQQMVAQQAGGLAANGDYAGARSAALNAGDFDLVGHINTLDDRGKKDLLEGFQQLGQYALLADTPEKWDAAVQHFVAQGHPEAQGYLGQFGMRDNIIANAGLAKEYADRNKPIVLSDGSQLVDASGRQLAENVKDRPQADWVFDSESGSWLQKPGTGTGVGGMPAISAPAPGGGSGVPRNVRNNNPGNIEDGAFARSQPGYLGGDGRFARFADAGAGAAAQGALLGSYINRGYNTVEKIISRWAPSSDGNDTAAYIQNVARALNVNPGDTLTAVAIPRLQAAIARQEGSPGPSSGIAPQSSAPGVINVRPPKSREREAPSGYRWGRNGNLQAIPGGPGDRVNQEKPPTESQTKAVGLLSSMVEAQNSLNEVSGYKPNEVALALNSLSNGNPLKQNLGQVDRRVLNAQLAFANSILRLESGAAIGPQETANKAQTLFPMPGDGPDVQRDKRRQREAAIRAMRAAAGSSGRSVPRVRANPLDRNGAAPLQRQQPATYTINGRQFRAKP